MKTCPSCGREYEDRIDICEECGAFLVKKEEEIETPSEEQAAPPETEEGELPESPSEEEIGEGNAEEGESAANEPEESQAPQEGESEPEAEQPSEEQPEQFETPAEQENPEQVEEAVPSAEEEPAPPEAEPTESLAAPLAEGVVKCSSCGWEGKPEDEYCPQCGSKLGEIPPVAESVKLALAKLVLPDSTEISIDEFPYQFGRKQMSSYPESDTISSKHFLITSNESSGARTFEIEDTNSLNGTSLNGNVIGYDRKSKGKFPIASGDRVSVSIDPSTGTGKFELTFTAAKNKEKE